MPVQEQPFGEALPVLNPSSRAALHIDVRRRELELLAKRSSDRLELVPSRGAVYVFVGDPRTGELGLAWATPGGLRTLGSVLSAKRASRATVEWVAGRIRRCYDDHRDVPRYLSAVAGRSVVVTPSDELARAVRRTLLSL
jgi:hypothetical protein